MSRRATIRTEHDDPALVARALRPDNTDEMETVVADDGDAVVTRIDRDSTGGLHSTVDDYVVNLEVAVDVAAQARAGQHDQPTDTGPVSDHNPEHTTHNE
ncbi:KEOPS complex subunit Pcc1 [Natronorubrum halophilum]|uniref:KEOPS complex subunit Pcc1 n=1 Tax=Natronorubrum halophilum TaxID=1702106 RepID=UPI000EF74921|nr:KEOPS complex subunit Pcc1 [Natronorubrum halophilum]